MSLLFPTLSAVPTISLVDARGLIGWTQARLASAAGLKVTAISDLETGRTGNPGYTTVMRIVGALQDAGLKGLKAEDIFPVDQERAS